MGTLAKIPALRRIKTELPPEPARPPLRVAPTPPQEPVNDLRADDPDDPVPQQAKAEETPVSSPQEAPPPDPATANEYDRLRAPKDWSQEVEELQRHFEANPPPSGPLHLNAWTRVDDPRAFLASHLSTLRAYNGNPHFLPFLDRLRALRALLTKEPPQEYIPAVFDENDLFM